MSRDGLLPKKFQKIHPKYQTPSFATIVTGVLVAVPALFLEDALVTDLTSIGTLFAFALVAGGVLFLPRIPKEPGRFSLPYINGKYLIPLIMAIFMYAFNGRIGEAVRNFGNTDSQEMLFLIFIVLAIILSVLTLIRNYSFIPIMGVLFCLYLMVEIPSNSWLVFFGWMVLGLLIYFLYGYRYSKLADKVNA
jgi:amino acid transporter